jgi:hypothetical protein
VKVPGCRGFVKVKIPSKVRQLRVGIEDSGIAIIPVLLLPLAKPLTRRSGPDSVLPTG